MQIKLTIPIRMAKTNGQKLDNAKCGCAAGHRPSPPLLVKRRSAQPLCSARRSLPHLCLPYDPAVSILMFMQEKRKHMLTCKPVCEQVQWFSSSSLETGPIPFPGRMAAGALAPHSLEHCAAVRSRRLRCGRHRWTSEAPCWLQEGPFQRLILWGSIYTTFS